MHYAGALLITLLTLGCNNSTLTGEFSGSQSNENKSSNSSTHNSPKEEERPSLGGEGVQGYLSEPEKVSSVKDGDICEFRGAFGATVDVTGQPASVQVFLHDLSAAELVSAAGDITVLRPPVLARTRSAADGSFVASVPAGQKVVIRFGLPESYELVHAFPQVAPKITAAFSAECGAPLEILTAPVVQANAPRLFMSDEGKCKQDGHFWDENNNSCDESYVRAIINHCGATPDPIRFEELVDDYDPANENDFEDDLKDKPGQGYTLEGCYFQNEARDRIWAIFLDSTGGIYRNWVGTDKGFHVEIENF